jgi:predicted nucleic acid-binding protein
MIIADTGFFVALGNSSDKFHPQAKEILTVLKEPLITTLPVIVETSHLLLKRSGNDAQVRFLDKVVRGAFRIWTIEIIHLERMLALMVKYSDLPMDLADASLVVLAEELGDGRILTTDLRDFRVYRWHNDRPFENLL